MNKQLLSLLSILVFLSAAAAFNIAGQREIKRRELCTSMRSSITRGFKDSLAGHIDAHAAAVYDFTKNTSLYGINDSLPLPLASLTKLMTVRVAMKTVKEDARYTVKKDDITDDAGTGFVPGDTYSVHDLLEAALISSSNSAATMLAKSTGLSKAAFISLMNFEAKNLGLASLRYESVTGLDTEGLVPTAVGSASDTVRLLYQNTLDMPGIMELGTRPTDTIRSTSGRTIELSNTDTIVKNIALLKASKTGYTVSAGGNLAVVWREPRGDILGAAVLGSSPSGRFTDILALHDASDLYIEALRALPEYCIQ